ncbi:MAG: phytase [Candidatus Hydrogenedentes bacterium]|nr:phytase [Candidatus Hydrogenedentota bacterium]
MRNICLNLACLLGVVMGHAQAVSVPATLETDPVPSADDAADDACFWVHPTNPEMSTVIGTDKEGGLVVYGLDGKQIQYAPDGKMNNVDIRYGFAVGGAPADVVVASNRSDDSLAVYTVDAPARTLRSAGSIDTGMEEVYGLCMYRSAKSGSYYVFVNSKAGAVQQWKLNATADGRITGELARSFSVGSQTEGCVADDDTGVFYIGEEDVAIWRYGAEPDAGTDRIQVDSVKPDGHLTADIEGLTIYYAPGTTGYLIASSQGDSTFAVYEREGGNKYLGSFQVVASDGIDAVTGSDGIDVLSTALGPRFAQGVFVTQDDANDGANQNFKLVAWESIAKAMKPALTIEPSRSPRR